MKKILIFSTAYYPHVGGAEVAIKEITDRLGSGYECDLICAMYSPLPRVEKIGAVTVHRVGWGVRLLDKLVSPFWGGVLALYLSRNKKYDLYWAMMATYGSGGAYIANILRFWNPTPVVLTLQEGDPPEYIRTKWMGLVGLSWRLALVRSTKVTVISNYLGKLAQEFGYTGKSILIPNAVDTKKFSGEKISHDGKVLITTSRLVTKNACDDVIRALPEVPSVKFKILGIGPDEIMLRELASKLGVADRVDFVGFVKGDDIPAHLHAADIFIRPSRSEGMGNSFVEAMAAELPVIATQEGGIADFLFDAKRNPDKPTTGWAVDKDSPQQITDAIKDIIDHPEKVDEVVKTAKALAFEKYDWDLIAKDMREKVFESI